MAKSGAAPLILSNGDIESLRIDREDITLAVEDAFRALHAGDADAGNRMSVAVSPGSRFTAKGGALRTRGYAAVKWYGVIANNDRRGLPDFTPLVILSSTETGLPLAVMDGQWLTAVRTASITAAAAGVLARPGSSSAGFVACGTQAESNLLALMPRFPLKRIVAYSRKPSSAERFAAKARELGLTAEVATLPQEAIREVDIVVTTVPRLSKPTRFLDAALLSPGTFVSMVDMGFAWNERTLGCFDEVFTDAFERGTRRSGEILNYAGAFAADLGEVLANPGKWRADAHSRRGLVFAGSGVADVAAAAVIYERAIAVRRWT